MSEMNSSGAVDHEVVIVGSGFSGIGAAIKLEQVGIHDFVVLERAEDIGGTWRDNDYPGLAVDMPSFIYCYPSRCAPTGAAFTLRRARSRRTPMTASSGTA